MKKNGHAFIEIISNFILPKSELNSSSKKPRRKNEKAFLKFNEVEVRNLKKRKISMLTNSRVRLKANKIKFGLRKEKIGQNGLCYKELMRL